MNAVFVTGLTTFLAASASWLVPAAASAGEACTAHVIQSDTTFPMRSQLRGQEGTVYLNVIVDENGRAREAQIERSSGYRLLDRAATRSVLDAWVFDVSQCVRKDLPITHRVAVEYRNDEYR
ncbi:MAG TPA: energy transducer TonB [Steroidobacter sp.]